MKPFFCEPTNKVVDNAVDKKYVPKDNLYISHFLFLIKSELYAIVN